MTHQEITRFSINQHDVRGSADDGYDVKESYRIDTLLLSDRSTNQHILTLLFGPDYTESIEWLDDGYAEVTEKDGKPIYSLIREE